MAGRNALILLGAGYGKRMGRILPKMLLPLCGKPLLAWTLENLERCKEIHEIILTVPPEHHALFLKKIPKKIRKLRAVVKGGAERVDSTRNALAALSKECLWIGIHDGARPFVEPQLLSSVFKKAQKTGAAILAVPVKDTIKQVSPDSFIQRTLPRQSCWAAQTPQVFRRDLVEKMHRHAERSRDSFTDDASIAESLGIPVQIVPGSYENLKITTPEDLLLAAAIAKKWKQLSFNSYNDQLK